MKTDSRISALVLAAGTSRRMGTVKQLLPLDGRPLIQHVLETVLKSGVSEVILVLGHSAEAIQRSIETQHVHVVVNENYLQGLGTSLKVGLEAVNPQSTAAIIMLADQPFVRSSTLDRLIEAHSSTGTQIVIPTYQGFRGNPVMLDRSVFHEAMGLSGDIGCRAIFGNHLEGIVKLPVGDPGILLDIDHYRDYEYLQNPENRTASGKVFLERVDPKLTEPADNVEPELVVVGRDAVAQMLSETASRLGFVVTIVDPFLKVGEMPGANRILRVLDFSLLNPSTDRHVVVASRGACDEEAIGEALARGSAYVGLLANKKRGAEVLRSLRFRGVPEGQVDSVRIPAGLEIGAETPEEIAISILAEIVAERRKRLARHVNQTRSRC
jgi:molybdenum cofactor cytidylyltransferase